ncbi:hypothetical protein OAU84_00320 [bacterium]|nr:hypothetical protein [bacterium]
MKNKAALVQNQVALPHPRKYRNVIRENLQAMAKGARPDMSGEELLADILGDSDAERVILTNANFICVPTEFSRAEISMLWWWKSSRPLAVCSKAMTLNCHCACVIPAPLFQRLMANLTDGRFSALWRGPRPLWFNGPV